MKSKLLKIYIAVVKQAGTKMKKEYKISIEKSLNSFLIRLITCKAVLTWISLYYINLKNF